MNTKIILEKLVTSHLNFTNQLMSLSKNDYEFSYQNKWNAGQHLEHILKSVAILSKVLSLPKWLLKYKFGKANRASRSYDQLIEKYLEKLKTAKSTPSRFQPSLATVEQREMMIKKLNKQVKKLIKLAKKYSENNLDLYIIPHPLLGKLTIRELLLFTCYHVEHHQELIENGLVL
jgi:hypothetical protein